MSFLHCGPLRQTIVVAGRWFSMQRWIFEDEVGRRTSPERWWNPVAIAYPRDESLCDKSGNLRSSCHDVWDYSYCWNDAQ
nr:hypothetical protein CFP56_46608 [Quercus suber]